MNFHEISRSDTPSMLLRVRINPDFSLNSNKNTELRVLKDTLSAREDTKNHENHWNSLKFMKIHDFWSSNGQKLFTSTSLTGERPVSEMIDIFRPFLTRSAASVNGVISPTALVFKRCYPRGVINGVLKLSNSPKPRPKQAQIRQFCQFCQ